MPFMGLGLHIFIAIFFAIHAVRTGREIYWLIILFMFPLLGSVVYLFAVYLPESRLQYRVQRGVSVAARSLDPGRELRDARKAYELTPTAQNQIRLANALLDSGDSAEAIQHFENCLQGPFARDPQILFATAKAYLEHGDHQKALDMLTAIRRDHTQFMPEQLSLLLARAYAALGKNQEAKQEFTHCYERYGSVEVKVEYAIWALKIGERQLADTIYADIRNTMKHWTSHARTLNKPLIHKMEAAFSAAKNG